MRRGLFAFFICTILASRLIATEPQIEPAPPRKTGNRIAVVDFTLPPGQPASDPKVVYTESLALSELAQDLIRVGQIKPDSPGVSKISDDRYRLVMTYPVENDQSPLSTDITPPKPRVQQAPTYPHDLLRSDTCGGAVVRLTIDKDARVKKVELVGASDASIGRSAVEAIKQWRFSEPARQNGKPIEVTLLQLLIFEIEGKPKHAPLKWRIPPEPSLPMLTVTGGYYPVAP